MECGLAQHQWLGGGGTTTITGATSFTGGTIGGGTTNLNGATAITGAATKTFSSGLIKTAATTTWSGNSTAGGNTINFNGATLDNTGTWQDQNTVSTTLQGVCCNGASTFNNMGTYTKSGAGVTTVAAIGFNNTGTVNANAGTLSFTNLDNFSGTTLTGGTFNVEKTLEFAGANIVTNAANISLKGSSSAILNSSNDNDALANFAVNARPGSFSLSGGRNFTTIGQFINNGTLNVGSGSTFTVNGVLGNFFRSTLTGGTYNVGGTLQFAGANVVTNAASISLSGSTSQFLNSTTKTNGLANLAVNAAGATFGISGGRNFTTVGKFTNDGSLNVGAGSTFGVGGALSNFSGSTLTGGAYDISGTLKFAGANIVTNAATIGLSGESSQILNSTTSANGLAHFADNAAAGSFTVMNGKTFSTAGNFANAGSFTVGSGSGFSVGGSGLFTQSAGKTTDDGTLSASGGMTLAGGVLYGTGSIAGNLQSSAAITPGNSSTSTGIFSTSGTYTQNSSGALNISIGGTSVGTQFDELVVKIAKLGGTLNLQLIDGYVPKVGSSFKIVGFGSETGTFATVNGLAINSSEHFAISYQGSDVLATVVAGPTTVPLNSGFTPSGEPLAGDRLMQFRHETQFQPLQSRSLWVNPTMHDAGLRGAANIKSASPASVYRPVTSRPRLGGKVTTSNLQFSFLNLLSAPHVSLGVN